MNEYLVLSLVRLTSVLGAMSGARCFASAGPLLFLRDLHKSRPTFDRLPAVFRETTFPLAALCSPVDVQIEDVFAAIDGIHVVMDLNELLVVVRCEVRDGVLQLIRWVRDNKSLFGWLT